MSFMNWEKSYELGIPEIDLQHKKWLNILCEFYDELRDSELSGRLEQLLDKVLDYTEYHFSEEEKLMQRIGYELLSEQKEMHAEIRNKIVNFRQQLRAGKLVVSMPVTNELKRWFKEHIMIEDRKYAEFYLAGSE